MESYDILTVLTKIKPYLELVLNDARGRCYSYGKAYMNDQDIETIDEVNKLLDEIEEIEEIINELNS